MQVFFSRCRRPFVATLVRQCVAVGYGKCLRHTRSRITIARSLQQLLWLWEPHTYICSLRAHPFILTCVCQLMFMTNKLVIELLWGSISILQTTVHWDTMHQTRYPCILFTRNPIPIQLLLKSWLVYTSFPLSSALHLPSCCSPRGTITFFLSRWQAPYPSVDAYRLSVMKAIFDMANYLPWGISRV